MSINNRYTVRFRRRRLGSTDYRARIRMMKSGNPRLVIRKTLNSITAQIITYSKKGDNVMVSASSGELRKFGWKASTGNIPSAYLVGLLIGKKALKMSIKEAIVDIGLGTSTKGSRIYSTLKGAIDAGLNIPHNKDVLPNEKRICGNHIVEYVQKLNQEQVGKRFGRYLKNNLNPVEIARLFETVKGEIYKS